MNQISNFIFGIYHYLLNLRDSMEYAIDREHGEQAYNERKRVLTSGIKPETPLGNFFRDNIEKSEEAKKIKERLEEFVETVYGDDSTILKLADGKVRVDHSQHILLFDYVCGLQESIRDILYGYVGFANQNHEAESIVTDLIEADDRLFRPVFFMLAMREFEKSFGEFQKVMNESKGAPTPQSNFIVNEEISKLSKMMRFCHQHHHCKENEIMDVLDQVLAVIEMTEGRRERRDNKSFKEIFDDVNAKLNALVGKYEPLWREAFQKALKEAIEFQNKQNENKKPN